MRTTSDGRGYVNILVADKLMENPRLYATFLLWLLSELFEQMPEVGDLDKPKLVFFFDEAHLLFNDAPKPLLDRIEQVVRLIRSKGVGVFLSRKTRSTCRTRCWVSSATACSMRFARSPRGIRRRSPRRRRPSGPIQAQHRPVITELAKGEALVSFLEGNGTPAMVERVMVRPPSARIGPITPEERARIQSNSPVKGKYDVTVDADSAYEQLQKRLSQTAQPGTPARRRAKAPPAAESWAGSVDFLAACSAPTGRAARD